AALRGQRDLRALSDGQPQGSGQMEIPADAGAGTDETALDTRREIPQLRSVEDDGVFDLHAVELDAGADRCVGADVRVRDADPRADRYRTAHDAVPHLG